MRFGVSLPNFGHLADPKAIADVARRAEELGYSSLWAAERLMVPDPPNQSWSQRDPTAFEPISTLAYVAGLTSRIRLCTGIVILPVRNPVLLARTAATLDVLSGGRLELGLGIGWMREEMDVSGIPHGKRGRIADDYLDLLRSVWAGLPYVGEFATVPPHIFQPRPTQGQIPIWIGGNSDAALRRAARTGDGWIPMGSPSPDELRKRTEMLREFTEKAGRDEEIAVSANLAFGPEEARRPGEVLDLVARYESAGATQVIPRFPGESIQEVICSMESFVDLVMSEYG